MDPMNGKPLKRWRQRSNVLSPRKSTGLVVFPHLVTMQHTFRTSTVVNREREEVFPFFADAENLERITPPELGFSIETARPIDMKEGTIIDYSLRLFGFSLDWRTRIAVWNPPVMFVDEQIAGPYRKWIHTHRFFDENGRTLMEDEVDYMLPFSLAGELAYPLIYLQLKRIFSFRQREIERIMASS